MSKSRIRRAAVMSLTVMFPTLLFAQSTARVGTEFQVNAYTSNDQRFGGVASDADGDFVVTWTSDGQDGAYTGIFARRFDGAGAPQGLEFLVNTSTTGNEATPVVAIDASGDFVIAWTGVDGAAAGVLARRFDAAGVPQGAAFQVNAHVTNSQYRAAVAIDADGDYVIAWGSQDQDGHYGGIFARLFTANGTPGAEFSVNVVTANDQINQAIARDLDGDFVVVWQSYLQDGDDDGVFGRRFNALGVAQAVEFQVSSSTLGAQRSPRVDLDSDGDFVVVWQGAGVSGFEIFAQRFDSLGARVGGELQVNAYVTDAQIFPAVAVDDSRGFVVSWVGVHQGLSDLDIFARHFDAFGTPLGREFQVNTFTTEQQTRPRLDLDANGDFVIVWESRQDGASYGVFAQRFRTVAVLDIDGNGATDPLTDGLLVLRYEFGFRGAVLITGAVGPGCTRCTAPEIEAYLGGLA